MRDDIDLAGNKHSHLNDRETDAAKRERKGRLTRLAARTSAAESGSDSTSGVLEKY